MARKRPPKSLPIPPFEIDVAKTKAPRGKRTTIGEVPPLDPALAAWVERHKDTPLPENENFEVPVPFVDPSELQLVERQELLGATLELARRRTESLRLFEPMPKQYAFFRSDASERVYRGGNRGGKTLAGCVEIARAATESDPFGKYPTGDGGRIIIVGKDLLHCSKVIYRKLFKPDAFKLIRDPVSSMLRAFRPGEPWDERNRDLCVPAPPLIPRRFYGQNSVSWDNKREEVPKTIRLRTGWDITFFSSLGAPPQGWDVDLVLFDEEIEHPAWYPEMAARLIDRRRIERATGRAIGGKFIWTATPQAGTQQLYDLSARAADCKGEPRPIIEEFHVTLLENTHLSESGKKDFIDKNATTEDEYRVRVLGDFALLGSRVYPEFTPRGAHGIAAFPIPDNWTRYMAFDPGHQVTAALFVAVPPEGSEYAGHVIFYDEIYLRKASAILFADALRDRLAGGVPIQEWLIDHRAGRMTQVASGKTPEQQYSEELKLRNVGSIKNKFSFTWASDDRDGGIEAVRRGLAIRDGRPRFLFMWEKLPMLLWEMERYSYKKLPGSGLVTNDPVKLNDHLCDDLRYLAMHRLDYRKPPVVKRKDSYAFEYIKAKKKRHAEKDGAGIKLG